MEVTILGQKVRVEIILISVILGYILGGHLLCSCARITAKEGLQMLGSAVDYNMGEGVSSSWLNAQHAQDKKGGYNKLEGNVAPNPSELINSGKLDILAQNKFDPKCCPATYTSSTGCACISPEQMKYLSTRGGNRTFSTEY
jgi:hypothetical protein